jgi:hypothetical protein
MSWAGCTRTLAFALALIGFTAPPVEAVEFVSGVGAAAPRSEGLLTEVRAVRHGGGAHRPVHRPGGNHHPPVHRPPVNRPGHRPPVHSPPVHRPGAPVHRPSYRPPVHRPGYRPPVGRPGTVVVAPRTVWTGRPGWYRWNPGGAIAAGAAIGFVAATAATWAGPPPQPGLCWYYTDPSRRQGFWDACP